MASSVVTLADAHMNSPRVALPPACDDSEKMQVVFDDDAYDSMLSEVLALPFRRRKNWKSVLLDNQGTKSRVIYCEGKLLNYSLIRHSFVEAVPQRSVRTAPLIACSAVGQAVVDGMDLTAAVEQQIQSNATGNHYRNRFVAVQKQSDGRVRG